MQDRNAAGAGGLARGAEGLPRPCQVLAAVLLREISEGFRIGYDASMAPLKSKKKNLISALEQPEVVSRYLAEEQVAGRVVKVGSIQEAEELGVHCSPFGVIPKRNRPNKWRLIVHLSAPEGESVNDGVSKELCSLTFIRVDDVVDRVLRLGKGALMAKMDIKQAYRNVPVHLQDRLLLGMQWQGQVYVDAALPFGLRSAPLIFSVLADVAQWIMEKWGVTGGSLHRRFLHKWGQQGLQSARKIRQ